MIHHIVLKYVCGEDNHCNVNVDTHEYVNSGSDEEHIKKTIITLAEHSASISNNNISFLVLIFIMDLDLVLVLVLAPPPLRRGILTMRIYMARASRGED